MNIKRIFLSAAAVVMSLTMLCSCGEPPGLRLGTGNPGGIYYAYGTVLRELDDCGIDVKKTEGSRANMRLMNEGFLDLAIVQSDVLAEAVSGTGDFEGTPVTGVRAVAGLYYEAFQIITRSDSGITELADLKGCKMSVGEEGSGVAKNAEYLLLSAGIPSSSVETVNMSYAESAQALENGEIDAFFVILGAPSTVVSELAESTDISIMQLDERTAARNDRNLPWLLQHDDPGGYIPRSGRGSEHGRSKGGAHCGSPCQQRERTRSNSRAFRKRKQHKIHDDRTRAGYRVRGDGYSVRVPSGGGGLLFVERRDRKHGICSGGQQAVICDPGRLRRIYFCTF